MQSAKTRKTEWQNKVPHKLTERPPLSALNGHERSVVAENRPTSVKNDVPCGPVLELMGHGERRLADVERQSSSIDKLCVAPFKWIGNERYSRRHQGPFIDKLVIDKTASRDKLASHGGVKEVIASGRIMKGTNNLRFCQRGPATGVTHRRAVENA